MENLKKMLKEKKEFSVACVIIIILLVVTIWLAVSKQVPKTKDGSEIVASIKGLEVTADSLYQSLKEEKGLDKALDLIDTYIADKEVKFTDEDEEYVDNIVDYYKQYADYYGVSFEQFLTQYAGINGVSTEDEFRDFVKADYKKSLAAIQYVGEDLTKEEIQDYYDENYSETMTAKHILIGIDEETTEEEALKEAKDIIKELNEVKDDEDKLNEKFKDLAFNHSTDGGSYANEGLIEDFSKKDVVSEFWDAAYELEDGEFTSEPVKSEYGYHIILKVSSSSQKKLKDVKKEIIKTLAQQKLSNDPELQNTVWDELRKKYKFKLNDSDMKKAYNKKINPDVSDDDETEDTEDTEETEE